MAETTNYYKVLDVSETISQEDLVKTLKRARRDAHPDSPKGSTMQFLVIQEAWKHLSTEDARKAYDSSLRAPKPSPQRPASSAASSTQQRPTTAPTKRPEANRGVQEAPTRPASQRPARPVGSKKPPSMQTEEATGDFVYEAEVSPQDERDPELSTYKFIPAQSKYLREVLGGLGVSLLGVLGMYFLWFSVALPQNAVVLIGAVTTLISVGFMTRYKREHKNGLYAGIILALGWLLASFPLIESQSAENPSSLNIGYTIFAGLFALGGATAAIFTPRLMEVRDLSKRVPVKILKMGRVFGDPAHKDPGVAATMRNVSSTLMQILSVKEGVFIIHMSKFNVNDKNFPGFMALIRGNKVALVTQMSAPPGGTQFDVDGTGNIVMMSRGGFTHIQNINPAVVTGAKALEKKFSGITATSLVIMSSRQPIETRHTDSTIITSRGNAVEALTQFFDDDERVVRRDVLLELSKYVTSVDLDSVV